MMEYLPSKYIPGGATYRARATIDLPMSVEDASCPENLDGFWVQGHVLAASPQNIVVGVFGMLLLPMFMRFLLPDVGIATHSCPLLACLGQ